MNGTRRKIKIAKQESRQYLCPNYEKTSCQLMRSSSLCYASIQKGRLLNTNLTDDPLIMLGPPVLVERKDSLFTFAAICEINGSADELITLSLRFDNDMAIGIDNAATGDKGAVVFFPSFCCVDAEACVRIASGLIRQMMMEESLLFLPLF
jgi:hypothetical protein